MLSDLPPEAKMQVLSKMRVTEDENPSGGITIRLTGATLLLLAILLAVAVVLIIWALQHR